MWGRALWDGESTEVTDLMEMGSMGTMEMWASVEVMSTTEMGQPGAQGWAVRSRISQGEEEEAVEVVWSAVVVLGEASMCEQGGGSAGPEPAAGMRVPRNPGLHRVQPVWCRGSGFTADFKPGHI